MIEGGDSGVRGDSPCGWDAILVDRPARRRKEFYGAMNLGTSGLAELMPYVQALAWYEHAHGPLRRARLGRPILEVAIVTDCKSLADQGRLLAADLKAVATVKANRPFWVAMLDFERHGYAFRYHWIDRCTIALNAFCDDRAGRGRKAIQALEAVGPPLTPEGRALSIYDVNPDPRASP